MIEAEDFIADAEGWLENHDAAEARRRSAVSRAYYGAYHEALRVAVALGYAYQTESKGSGHEQLRKFLSHKVNTYPELNAVVYNLKRMFDHRNIADYYIDSSVSCDEAWRTVKRARAVLTALGTNERRGSS